VLVKVEQKSNKKSEICKLCGTYIAETSQHSWDTLTRTIDARDEVHPRAYPIERSHNGELKTIFGTLSC